VSWLLLLTHALACDDAAFRAIPEPPVAGGAKGVATGESTLDGKPVIGVRFAMPSQASFAGWKAALADLDSQDQWVPDQFGYEYNTWIDASHAYLRFDVGLVFGAIHVRRQLVAVIRESSTASSYTTCWRMVDPEPFKEKIAAIVTEAEWEKASAGWWSVRQQASGVTVGYQWWTEVGKMPTSVMKYGMTTTLPALMDAFEARAQALADR